MLSKLLLRSGLLFKNLNGLNQLGDAKFIAFGFVSLHFTFKTNVPLNFTPFNLTKSSQTCFGAVI